MKTTLQQRFTFKLGLLLGTACLLSFQTMANEPVEKNPQEGTLVGAIQTLIKNNRNARHTRTITGNISIMQGFVSHPYVMVKGAYRIVFVDNNGNFQIDVPENDPVLIIGGSGIAERELALSTDDHYDIGLLVEEDQNPYQVSLYGMPIDRRSYNGAFSRVNEYELRSRAAVTVGTALEGAVAGLQVTGIENGIGAPDLLLTIRGIGSLRGNTSPLIILDGAPYTGPLHAINPMDVGDITVLKDGMAKAVYGARGGNGIVMITTKRGWTR